MKKLLNRTLIYYSVFAVLMLLLATPFFYWMSQKLHVDDVDEAIRLREKEFLAKPKWNRLSEEDIEKWNEFNRDIKILPDTSKVTKGKIIDKVFYDALDDEWEPYRLLYRDIQTDESKSVLMIRINLIESEDLMQATGIIFLAILLILLVGFVLVTRVVSGKLWSPFYQTLHLIEAFDIEQKNKPHFPDTKTLEFHKLKLALEELITENIKAFEREKEFTQNASHELQTPLAIFQSKLDILLQNPDLTEEQAIILQQLYHASARLLRINKNLLLLSKIEHKPFSHTEPLSIEKMITDVLPYFEEQAVDKTLNIEWHCKEEVSFEANKGLTEILVNNLFMNAIRHNVSNGHIYIRLTRNMLTIKNSGITEPLDEQNIFQRFSSGTRHSHSSGLGLAIVKKIAELNHWQIAYNFENNEHIFSVTFH